MKIFDTTDAAELLTQFKLTNQQLKSYSINKGEILSPDSEIIAINMWPDKTYVLYVEDFIESLNYVEEKIKEWAEAKTVKFIKPKQEVKFENTIGAQYYVNPPKTVNEWAKYTVQSGHD